MPFLSTQTDGSLILSLHVQPRASRTGLTGIHGGSLKIAITAPPVEGKANKEVIAFLAAFFKIPKKEITIVGGLQSRTKRCSIRSLTESEARARIAEQIGEIG
jgi:uncharacterized protein